MNEITQPTRRRSWRRKLLQWHMYGGLLCSSYLVIYGVSTVHFNHPWGLRPWEATVTSEWEITVEGDPGGEDVDRARHVVEQSDLIGWVVPWTIRRSDAGGLAFQSSRPGRVYDITYEADGRTRIQATDLGLWSIVDALHGGGRVPGSFPMTLWRYFTLLSVGIGLLAAASGVYLWAVSGRDRVVGVPAAVAGTVGFVVLVLLVAS